MFKKLARQLKENTSEVNVSPMTSPIRSVHSEAKKSFLKNLSKHALNLYERKKDVKKFTKLVLSDQENKSHEKMVEELFNDSLSDLAENENFLKDLGL